MMSADRAEDLRTQRQTCGDPWRVQLVLRGDWRQVVYRFALETKRGPRLGGVWKAGLGPAVMVAGLGSWCSGRLVHCGSKYGRKEGSTELGDSKNRI